MTKHNRGGHPGRRSRPARQTNAQPPAATTSPANPAAVWATPPAGAPYPQLLRSNSYSPRRSIAGIVLGLLAFLVLAPLVSQLVVFTGWSTTAAQTLYADYSAAATRFERPVGMLAANLGIAVLIPISIGLVVLLHYSRPGWLASVTGRTRARFLAWSFAAAGLVLGGIFTITLATTSTVLRPQPGFWGFLIVIVLTSPLQAAAEEVFFRGYLSQALGSLIANPWFGIVASALVFAFFHGGQNLPLFIDRLAFGLLAGLLVLGTGGLEAAIAAHIINNLLAYILAGLTSSITQVRAVDDITWPAAAVDIGGFALYTALAYAIAQRSRTTTRTDELPPRAGQDCDPR